MKSSTYSHMNIFCYILVRIHQLWRAFLRKRSHPALKKLYTKDLRHWIPKPKGTLLVPTLYGFRMIIDADSDQIIGHSLYYDGTYEAGTLHILSQCLAAGDTFVDVGSNIGLMALYGSKRVRSSGKVLAFEPEPGIFKTLQSNVEINDFRNIRLFSMALGNSDQILDIYNSQTNRGQTSLIKSDQLTGPSSKVHVKRLDDILSQEGVESVKMMKIDVEGWELEVLKGAEELLVRSDAPIICIESSASHPVDKGTPKDVYNYISRINEYRIFKLSRGKGKISKLVEIPSADNLPDHDNIFCFLPHHKQQMPYLFA